MLLDEKELSNNISTVPGTLKDSLWFRRFILDDFASGGLGLSVQATPSALPPLAGKALGIIVLVAIAGLPFAPSPGPEVPGLTSVFSALLFVTELATAMLLLVRFRVERRPWLVLLVCAYLYSALMAILYLLAFPGALQPSRTLIGAGQTASWLFVAWTFGMPIAGLAGACLEMCRPHLVLDGPVASRVLAIGIALTAGFVACITAIVVRAPALPALVAGGRWTGLFMVLHLASTALMLLGVAVIAAGPGKRSDLLAWFGVTLMAMAVANMFAAVGGERYSLGWTVARIGYAAGACVLFGFFLWLFAKQQKLLAGARERLAADVEARTTELRHMVAERDALLSEVYHRVLNNLQVLRSMLHLERRNLGRAGEAAALARMERRTLCMGVVHRKATETHSSHDIDVAAVIAELALKLEDLLALDGRDLRIEVRVAAIRMKLEAAVPLGLLIQELVANMVERIDAPDSAAIVTIALEQTGGSRRLAVTTSAATGLDDPDSLENRIIAGLIEQLGGSENFSGASSATRVVTF